MKHILPIFILLLTCGNLLAQKTIYVKHDATGANTGTSWADAYASLTDALTNAVPGDQVWVAAGTYKPVSMTPNASFAMQSGISLYGGFNGTETMLSARNPETNVTVLSGDLAGNDLPGDFAMNRSDNSIHVVEVSASANPAGPALIDGFTISGGHTLTTTANPDLTRRGGGIMTTTPLTVRNCLLSGNFGDSGGAMAILNASASGSLVESCVIEANMVYINTQTNTSGQSAGIFVRDVSSLTVKDCVFRNNRTSRGCLYPFNSLGVVIDNCTFENNDGTGFTSAGLFTYHTSFTVTNCTFFGNMANGASAWYNDDRDGGRFGTVNNCLFENNTATGTCGGFYNWQGNLDIRSCTFRGNAANAATSMYFDGRNGNINTVIENCLFENNTANGFGAGFYNWQGNYQMRKCTFRANIADNAVGVYNDGRLLNNQFTMDSCLFDKNEALDYGGAGLWAYKSSYVMRGCTFLSNKAGNSASALYNGDTTSYLIQGCHFEGGLASFGGAVANYGADVTGTYKNCVFLNNKANTSGGALTNGFEAQTTVDSCHFEGNLARFGAGIFCQDDYTALTVRRSAFVNNSAEDNGGGINIGAGIVFNLENSRFEVNTADRGGALEIAEDSLDLTVANITNCVFQDNFALTQGAAFNLSNAVVNITNCLVIKNTNIGSGAGGGISNNASAGKTASVKIVNSTFADNTAVIGAGIAQWEGTGGTATLELQNTILSNAIGGVDYEIEDGEPEVTSLGGNLCTDFTLNAELTAANDQTEMSPLFVDPDFYDFHLKAGSPCINTAIAAGAPPLDLEGNSRVDDPDKGCYEFQTVGTHAPGSGVLPLRLIPNPVVDQAVVILENDYAGAAQVMIVSQNGARVRTIHVNKTSGRWVQRLDVQHLPAGVYSVQVRLGEMLYEGSLVKQ
ncbi:MAG: right-handed parallel beta-helix repeat-containing protein [Saprospirales bacterium]|nr:right-handed parallel beta-helix repeat-containing protein [Saprospirales bacterium]